MADKEQKLRTDSSSVSAWVDAYWGDNNEGYDSKGNDLTSKPEKFRHLQHLSTFSTVAYYVNNNSPKAHVDFFDRNYTHMSSYIEKAAQLILKLMEVKFERSTPSKPYVLTDKDFTRANDNVGLFSPMQIDSRLISDYIGVGGLVESCSHFVPVFNDNSRTVSNLKEINNDEMLVAHHGELVGACGGDKPGCALNLKDIRGLNRRAVEVASTTWESVEKDKSSDLKKMAEDANDTFYKASDLAIKTGKVGALAGGAAYCVGCVMGGMFWPALGLIPIYHIAKKWLPDMFGSVKNLFKHFGERIKDRREYNQSLAEEYYLKHNGDMQFWDSALGRIPKPRREFLDKQLKTMNLFYGEDNLANRTSEAISKAGSYSKSDSIEPIDVLGRWNSYADGLEKIVECYKNNKPDASGHIPTRTEVFSVLQRFASDLKKNDGSVTDDAKDAVYGKFYEQMNKYFDTMLFEKEYSGSVKNDFENFYQDADVLELIKQDKLRQGLAVRYENMKTFIAQEKQPIIIYGKNKTMTMLGSDMGVSIIGLMADNEKIVKEEYKKILDLTVSQTAVDDIVDRTFRPDCDKEYSVIHSDIDILIPDSITKTPKGDLTSDGKLKNYLNYMLDCRRAATLKTEGQLNDEHCFDGLAIKGISLAKLVSELNMILTKDSSDKSHFGEIYSNGVSLQEIKNAISTISNDATKKQAFALLDEQLQRLNTKIQLTTKADTSDAIRKEFEKGDWGLYGSNFKNPEGKTGPVISNSSLSYTTEGLNNANQIFKNITENIPAGGKLNYLYFKLSDFMYSRVFVQKLVDFERKTPDLKELVEFLQNVNSACYLNQAQKALLISKSTDVAKKVVGNSIETLGATLLTQEGKTTTDMSSKLKLSISGGGLKELFSDDELKKSAEYLNTCSDYSTVLEMKNGEKSFAWIDTELKFVKETLFDEGKIRAEDDFLRKFIGIVGNIDKNGYNKSGTIFLPDEVESGATFSGIKDALDFIKNKSSSATDDEKVSAYLILKNKAVSLLHLFMETYKADLITNHSGKTFDNIVIDPIAKAEILAITSKWNGLFAEIDNAITNALGTGVAPRQNKSKAADAISRYEADATKWQGGSYGMGG